MSDKRCRCKRCIEIFDETELEKLEAENKILRKEKCLDEILESYAEYNDKLKVENKALKESKNELYRAFKAWQVTEDWLPSDRMLNLLEALKEKETK